MSELQLGLLAIGAVVVAGVFFYNKWQEARYRREVQAGFGSRHDDVLMGLKRGAGDADRALDTDRADPAFGTLGSRPGGAEALPAGLSEALDFIVPIETPGEVSGAAAASAAAAVLGRCSKPVLWEGFDAEQNRWEPLAPDRRYSRLRAGMQLVDRRGAADEGELAAFGAAVEEAAASIGLLAAAPPAAQAAHKGRELDRFCGEVDIRVAVHIQGDAAPFPGSRLAGLAASLGFELDEAERRFLRRDEDGRVLFALADFGPAPFDIERLDSLALRAATFELDVPRTPRGAFGQFRDLALSLAQGLNSRIVDDNRQPLGAAAFDAIEAQVQSVHSSMEARGIVPGGVLALRLFS
jgi:FtsZ-interacting cell division protein ZipA